MPDLKIGELARRAETSAPTVRYYEQIGLLPAAGRRNGGHRCYDEEDVRRLTFIRRCRDAGFSIEEVRTLTMLVRDGRRSCSEARDLARSRLEAVRAKLDELTALKKTLARFVDDSETTCAGGPGPDCTILQELSQPRLVHRARQQSPSSR